jgi:hypothetical protein
MLVPAVVTLLLDGYKEGWVVMQNWMDQDGVEWRKKNQAFEWIRGSVWWEEREVARIVRVFYMLVNKNRGVGGI